MNETGSGTVALWEFREYFDLPDDRSTTRLFRCFDEDRDNRIGFLELVVGMWTYCETTNAHPAKGRLFDGLDLRSPAIFWGLYETTPALPDTRENRIHPKEKGWHLTRSHAAHTSTLASIQGRLGIIISTRVAINPTLLMPNTRTWFFCGQAATAMLQWCAYASTC